MYWPKQAPGGNPEARDRGKDSILWLEEQQRDSAKILESSCEKNVSFMQSTTGKGLCLFIHHSWQNAGPDLWEDNQ